MASRVCLDCPAIGQWTRGRCPDHDRARDKARGRRQARGYDAAHDREAKRWRDLVRAGQPVTCWRCGNPINDADDLHLGHDDDDRSITRGPEHGRRCNLSAAGRSTHK